MRNIGFALGFCLPFILIGVVFVGFMQYLPHIPMTYVLEGKL